MDVPGEAARLRIFIGANDVHEDQPLSDWLVLRALGLAGATALCGLIGYGQPSHAKSAELLLSHDRPIVIEVVDSRDRIDAYLVDIQPTLRSGLVTVETIEVPRYGAA